MGNSLRAMATIVTKFSLFQTIIRNFQRIPGKHDFSVTKNNTYFTNPTAVRSFSTSLIRRSEEDDAEESESAKQVYQRVDLQTSMRYMKSKAFETTYRGAPVWVPYRRNHKGQLAPQKTRKTCIRAGVVTTGNPCPICRDNHLAIHPKNLDLMKQFIDPNTGDLISYSKTGVCQKQHRELQIALLQAWDLGLLEKPLPFKRYNYREFYPQLKNKKASS